MCAITVFAPSASRCSTKQHGPTRYICSLSRWLRATLWVAKDTSSRENTVFPQKC